MTGLLCPVCGSEGGDAFLEVADAPVFCNVLWPTASAARAAPRGDIALCVCERCGMVWNTSFDPAEVEYAPGYENSLHFSPVFHAFATSLAERLVERHGLHGKHIVDIGAGRGDFLALLCARGRNTGVGYDPSHTGTGESEGGSSVRLVADLYTPEHAEADPPDFVVSRHVLEHVADPLSFLRELRAGLEWSPNAVVYVEVPAGDAILRDTAVWDVIYEHPSYFTAGALRTLFTSAGFRVLDEGLAYGDQYRWIEAEPAEPVDAEWIDQAEDVQGLRAMATAFGEAHRERIAFWNERIPGNGRFALWGAGSKGVTFLNGVPAAHEIAAVIDVNPRKHGRYVPGTGHEVRDPQALADDGIGTIVALNALYREEIARKALEVGLEARVEVA